MPDTRKAPKAIRWPFTPSRAADSFDGSHRVFDPQRIAADAARLDDQVRRGQPQPLDPATQGEYVLAVLPTPPHLLGMRRARPDAAKEGRHEARAGVVLRCRSIRRHGDIGRRGPDNPRLAVGSERRIIPFPEGFLRLGGDDLRDVE